MELAQGTILYGAIPFGAQAAESLGAIQFGAIPFDVATVSRSSCHWNHPLRSYPLQCGQRAQAAVPLGAVQFGAIPFEVAIVPRP